MSVGNTGSKFYQTTMSCHFLLAARCTVHPWVRCSFAVKREQVPCPVR